jgi:hypothetical protein
LPVKQTQKISLSFSKAMKAVFANKIKEEA